MRKKVLSTLLALCMVMSLLPATAFAADDDLAAAQEKQAAFQAEYDSTTGKISWNTLFQAVLAFNKVQTDDAAAELKAYYAGIEKIDLSNQAISASIYSGTDTGVLVPFTGLKTVDLSNTGIGSIAGLNGCMLLESVDVSDNADLSDFAALASKPIKELNLSNTGADNNSYGALVTLPLETLNLSGNEAITSIGPITTNGSSPVCASSLKTLDISGTGMTVIQEVWNGTTSKPSLPNLTTLVAKDLELTSISGLVEVASQSGFNSEGITWNLSDSTLHDATNAAGHILTLTQKMGGGSFTAPTLVDSDGDPVENGILSSLSSAQTWKNKLVEALDEDGEKENLTWDALITAIYWYETATTAVSGMTDSSTKTACQNILNAIKTAYAGIETLDMSGKSSSRYDISTGALKHFTGLKTLNLSNTGISETGGLKDMNTLTDLDLSGNSGIDNNDLGALVGLKLETLNLSGTGITDIGGLTGTTEAESSNNIKTSLRTLDISATGVTKLESVWQNGSAAFSALTSLTASGLTLESISGLVEIACADSFSANDVTWNLGDSTLTSTALNGEHLEAIQSAFGDAGGFTAPDYNAPEATDLDNAEQWKTAFMTALGEDAGKEKLTWDTLITAVYYYQQASTYVAGLEEGEAKAAAAAKLDALTDYYADIKKLDMSGKSESKYAISTGALIHFSGLEELNLSGTGISEVGGLKDMNKLAVLDLSGNTGIQESAYGVLAGKSLTSLNLSGTGISSIAPLTKNNGGEAPAIAASLATLDISDTNITDMNVFWTGSEASMPALKSLTAQDLELTSIAGLAEVARAAGFDDDGVTWDLSESTLSSDPDDHIGKIREKFDTGTFAAPTVAGMELPATLVSALKWKNKLAEALGEDGGKASLTWDALITSVYWYETATKDVAKLSDPLKTTCEGYLQEISEAYAGIKKLDMSDKNTSQYAISTGALIHFSGLEELNLSGTGINETGGLKDMTALKILDLSNTGIDETAYGVLAGKSLTSLNLSGTRISSIAPLTKHGGDPASATSLVTLDISGTSITDMNVFWTGSEAALPALKALIAKDLELTSIAGLAEVARADGFSDSGVTWNLSESILNSDPSGHVSLINGKFDTGTFNPPTVPPLTYTVTLPFGAGFTAAAADSSASPVVAGGNFSFTVTISDGYQAGEGFAVKANGVALTETGGTYTISSITADQVVTVEGVIESSTVMYTISATAKTGGTISPSGSVSVTEGNSKTFTISANTYYSIADVKVDGTSVGKVGTYTFFNVTKNHTIEASFTYTGGGGGGGGGGGSSPTTYAITVEDAANGDVTVKPTRASSGTTVTLTVDPDEGYELDKLTVTDKDGKKISLTDKGNGTYTFKMPSGKVTVEASFTKIQEQAPVNPFTDVAPGSYYYDAVLWAVENGITSGTSTTTFSPSASCTRAQTVTFLWRAAGSPAAYGTNPFTDVSPNAYYYDAVLWAVQNGITNGTSATTFSPDAVVTRGQNVTFLWRWAGSHAAGQANPFTDVASDAYYYDAVLWAADEGLTAGTSATTFSPNDPCLRSQIVTFLYRYMGK